VGGNAHRVVLYPFLQECERVFVHDPSLCSAGSIA
jgi:hypothetical protein